MVSALPDVNIMGVLNATPDSFSGDGTLETGKLVERGLMMIEQGAGSLDIGGESSAPYTDPVAAPEVTARVIPVLRALRRQTRVPLAVDTYHVETARAAVDAGADIINDITGFRNPEMIRLAAGAGAGIVIMHMQGQPRTMQDHPSYRNVVEEVRDFLHERVDAAVAGGIPEERIILDPGIGFGKNLDHNLSLIRNLDALRKNTCRILLGASRKSMIGQILDTPVYERLEGSLAAAAAGVMNGADIVRVHDVLETRRFLTVFRRIMEVPAV